MRVHPSIQQQELLALLRSTAQSVHVRLALTATSEEIGSWIARSLVVDVFPQAFLDNPDNVSSDDAPVKYQPPVFLYEYEAQACFFAGFVPTEWIINWLGSSDICELAGFDHRPGRGSRVLRFAMPALHDEVFGTRVYSGRRDGFALLPWPHNTYRYNLKNPSVTHNSDYETLYAMDQPHFDNLREARAKLIHGYTTGQLNYQDSDDVTVRFIDTDGWISKVALTESRVDVSVSGIRIFPGRVILKGGHVDDEKTCSGPEVVSFTVTTALTNNPNIILANEREELDRVWLHSEYSQFDPPVPHVITAASGRDVHTSAPTETEISRPATAVAPDSGQPSGPMSPDSKRTAKSVQLLRVVVASPSDVKKERECVPSVLAELNRGIAGQFGLRLEPWMWETDTYPGFHANGPQGQVDDSMNLESADIVIGIFKRRFGTPVSDARSGTEHELRRALSSWKQRRRPYIMIYFGEGAVSTKNLTATDLEQLRSIVEFREEIGRDGLYWSYRGARQFEDTLRQHLQQLLRENYTDQTSLNTTSPEEHAESADVETSKPVDSTSPDTWQTILHYLVTHFEPEAAISLEDVSQATDLQGQELVDALHELGDMGIIRPLGNSSHRYNAFILRIAAWDHVQPDVLGFDVQDDMLKVAEAANASGQHAVDRDELLRTTGLPSQRLDVAALLLAEHGNLNLHRPIVRGLTFRAALPDHRTRQFIREHRRPQ